MTEQRNIIRLSRPNNRKAWGIDSANPRIIPDLKRAALFASEDSPMSMSSKRVVDLWERMAAGFPRIEYGGQWNTQYLESVSVCFYAREDIVLDAALAMAEYIGCDLELE